MPFIRTFAPFVAGVAEMSRRKFTAYNVGGALLWVVGLTLLGYFFGNLPWVKEHLSIIIWSLIMVIGPWPLTKCVKTKPRNGAMPLLTM